MRTKATTGTYTHQTDDGKCWNLEYTYEPYNPGTYWDPPEGGYAVIEGDATEAVPAGQVGKKIDLDDWRKLYSIDDKAWAAIEEEASQEAGDAMDRYDNEED